MTEYLRLVLVFFAAVNPAAVALAAAAATAAAPALRRPAARAAAAVIGLVVAVGLFGGATLAAEPLLDALDIAPETFRIAAGIVMAIVGAYAVWRASVGCEPASDSWEAGVFPFGLPLLAGPASLIAAVSYAVDRGEGKTLGAAVVPVAVAAGLIVAGVGRWRPAADAVARVTGALLIALACGLIVEGVRDI
jgi:small neutral amino acid transporter SnatA (MarC family)